jgi:hypothetical protein
LAILLLAGEKVRAPKAGEDLLHSAHDGAREVDEFALEPVVDRRCVLSGGCLQRADEVLGKLGVALSAIRGLQTLHILIFVQESFSPRI